MNKIRAFPEQVWSKKQSKNRAFKPKKQSTTEFLPKAAQTQHKSLKKALGCQLGSIKVIISNLKQTTGHFETYCFCQS